MSIPSKLDLFIDDARELNPLENSRKNVLMDVLASRKGNGPKDRASQKKSRSDK